MSIFARKQPDEEQPGGGAGQELDLDLKACPVCRRDLYPWEDTCPDDGAPSVPRPSLRQDGLPPPPLGLLADDEPADPDARPGGSTSANPDA